MPNTPASCFHIESPAFVRQAVVLCVDRRGARDTGASSFTGYLKRGIVSVTLPSSVCLVAFESTVSHE